MVQAASTSIHDSHGQHIENIHLQVYSSNEHFSTLGWWPRFGGFAGARVLIFDGYQPILLLDKTDDLVDFDDLLPLRDFLQLEFER